MKKIILGVVSIIVLFVAFTLINQETENEINNQQKVSFNVEPVSHASAIFTFDGVVIYNDPVGELATFENKEDAEIILLSDVHGDHLNIETLQYVTKPGTIIIAPQAVIEELTPELISQTITLSNNEIINELGISITATPMYNLPESEDSRHTKGRGNGYILEKDGLRVYIAGDTADTPEMRSLENIDIAFVPMNLPYTMSVETAADAVLDFSPKKVYPYHYRGQNGLGDVNEFKRIVNEGNSEIEVVLLNWYPETVMEMENEVSTINNSYVISSNSSVSYTVQKEFLSRPTEPVTGTTGDVSGELMINRELESISINAVISPQTLDSGSGARDNHVRDEFVGDILVQVDNFGFEISEQISFVAPVNLTMNGITKTLDFDIQGSILEEEVSFKGSSNINMLDFNIDPPSTLGIYGVNEIAEISFDLFAN